MLPYRNSFHGAPTKIGHHSAREESRIKLVQLVDTAQQSRAAMAEPQDTVWARLKRNLGHKHVWGELSGSVGDLGTFLPIVLALVLVNGLDLGTSLLFTGAYNVVTGESIPPPQLCFPK